MADSCRPVSRHGRYNANHDRSDVQYTDKLHSYPTVDYRGREDVYGNRHSPVVMETLERPQTGRGFRRIRPSSRGGREEVFDESKTGRPSSRVGFRPETYDRHDYDEFSRQEHPVVSNDSDSGESSPGGGNNSPAYASSPSGYKRNIPSQKHVVGSPHDRMSVSPHEEYLSAHSPSAFRLLSREKLIERSPAGSPNQEHTSHKHNYSPRLNSQQHQDHYTSQEQIFDFEEPFDRRQQEGYQPHFGKDLFQNVDSHGQQSYGHDRDYRPPSRDSPRQTRNRSFVDNEETPSGYTPILSGKNRYQYDHYQHSDHSHRHESDDGGLPIHEEPIPTPRPTTSSRPRSSRPKSARRRQISARKRKEEYQQDDTSSYNQEHDVTSQTTVRPPSSFLRYKPLPAIGSNETTSMTNQERADELAEQTKQLHLQESYQSRPGSARNRPGSARNRPESASYMMQQPFSSANEILFDGQTQQVATLTGGRTLQGDVGKGSDIEESSQSDGRIHKSELSAFRPHKLPDEPKDSETRLLLAVKLPDGKRIQRYFRVADRIELVKQFAENELCSDLSNYQLSCNAPKVFFTNLSQMICDAGLEDRTLLFLVEK